MFRRNTPPAPVSPLRLTNVECGDPTYSNDTKQMMVPITATANKPVEVIRYSQGGFGFEYASVTLARVLAAAGLAFDLNNCPTRPTAPNNMVFWDSAAAERLTLDELNDDLASDMPPKVRIVPDTRPQYPGLIHAHSDTAIGFLSKFAVRSSSHICDASHIQTGETITQRANGQTFLSGAEGLYAPNTLFAAVAAPGSSINDAMEAVRFGLTL